MTDLSNLKKDIETVLNVACAENESNTPDWILANYLLSCLEAFDKATQQRDEWYGVHLEPANKYFKESE
jgi:hypothetical protein